MTQWHLKPPTFFDRLRRFTRLIWRGFESAWHDSFKVSPDNFYGVWKRNPPEEIPAGGLHRVRMRFHLGSTNWRGAEFANGEPTKLKDFDVFDLNHAMRVDEISSNRTFSEKPIDLRYGIDRNIRKLHTEKIKDLVKDLCADT